MPGIPKGFDASSSTSTQSSISPGFGGVNSRSPVFGNSPIAAAPPSRGLNHHAFTFDDGGDLVMVFLAWPFADSPEWNVKLRIAPGQERDVKMHRQWPMLRVFSKSNPKYGLPALSR